MHGWSTRFVWNSVTSTFSFPSRRRDAVNDGICAVQVDVRCALDVQISTPSIVRSPCCPSSHSASRAVDVHIFSAQTVVQSFVVSALASVCESKERARDCTAYSSAIAVGICRQARTLKLSFDFFSWSTDHRSKSRHPRPEPVLHTSTAVLG